MNAVRPFFDSDINSVAELFLKVFRKSTAPPSAALKTYFREIYLSSPWVNDSYPSLVYEHEGKVRGFLGRIPFPMKYKGKEIVAAIGGNYMVDPEFRNPLAGVRLLKTFLSGPQNISMTDTANELGLKMWQGLGGVSAPAYGLQWIRLIRPGRFGSTVMLRSNRLAPLRILAWPVALVADSIIRRTSIHPRGYTKDLESRQLFEYIGHVSKVRSLSPSYTPSTLDWIIRKAEEKRQYGALRKLAVYAEDNSVAGWFLYYPNPGGIGQVLQIGSFSYSIDLVLKHLFHDAINCGSLAVMGRTEPGNTMELTQNYCLHVQRSNYLAIHSFDVDLLRAVHSGDAFLSRMEGEWWTRFQGDSFDE
jgi:hypothetical protein